nr:SMP-30/gluconolactonase/LRE family protein [uncultured Blautia sp.]
MKKLKHLLLVPIILVLICMTYLMLHMPEVSPTSWQSPQSNGYTGSFSQNNNLKHLSLLDITPYTNPETVMYYDNWLYASVDGGIIIRLHEDGTSLSEVINTGGAIVGFDFDSHGNIVFADAAFTQEGGAICIAYKEKNYKVSPLVTEYEGKNLMFPDGIAVDNADNIYFTDACEISAAQHSNSTTYASNIDHIAHTKTGKLYIYSTEKQSTEFIAGGFSFANGISISQDETSVFLSETSEYRIWKIDSKLRNAQVGDNGMEIIIQNLPGFPDNLSPGENGQIWIGLVSPRSDFLDSMSTNTLIRKMLLNLPDRLLATLMDGEQYSHICSISESGKVITNLQATEIDYTNITGVCETSDRLYLHSICGTNQIAYIEK